MSTTTTAARDTLNNLLETCLDGEHGYEAAAESVKDPALQTELQRFSRQRASFAGELRRLLADAGEEPVDHGSVSGALHRGWMSVRQSISSDNRHAILAECERGEDAAMKAYRQAMEETMTAEASITIESQYSEVMRAHDRIKALRDASENTASAGT